MKKPTYEELEQRVKEFEKAEIKCKRVEETLRESEHTLDLMINTAPDIIYRLDSEGKVLFVNKAVSSLGYSPEELIDTSILDIVHPDDKEQATFRINERRCGDRGTKRYELRLLSRDGMSVSFEDKSIGSTDPVFLVDAEGFYEEGKNDTGGRFLGTLGVARDITERKKGQEEIAKNLSLLESTMMSTADGILVVHNSGIISFYNERFKQLWKIPDKLVNQKDDKVLLDYVLSQLVDSHEFMDKVQYLYDHPAEISEDLLHFKDGRIFERYSRPQKMECEIIGRVWSFRDVTKQIEAEQELKRSNEKHSSLIANISDVIVILDKNGIIQYKSPNITEHFGWHPEELIGKDGFITTHPDDKDRIMGEFVSLLKAVKTKIRTNFKYLCKNGDIKIVELTARNLLNNPNVNGILANYKDITERKKAEEQLKENEEKYRDLFENMIDSICLVHKDGKFIDVNYATEKLTEYSKDELLKMRLSELVHPEDKKKSPQSIDHFYKKGYYNYQGRILTKNNRIRYVEVNSTLIKKDGEVFGSRDIIRDITERKQLEEQLQIRQRMDSLGTLAGGMTHDFNNILTSIMGNIDLLKMKSDNLTESQKKLLSGASVSTERASILISRIQALSKGRVEQDLLIDLYDISKEVFGMLNETTNKLIRKQIMFKKGIFFINGVPSEINQAILNLGINSIEAIEERGAKKGDYVRITAENYEVEIGDKTGLSIGNYIHLSFEDNGAGMSKEVLRQAFDPLFTTKDKFSKKGQGLDLAMVYNIVTRKCYGHIEIDSTEGIGTTFHIYLPKALQEVEK